MMQMLFYLLLFSLPTLISTHVLITESEDLVKRSIRRPIYKDRGDVEVYSLKIDSKITSRFAHNVITSRVINRAPISREALFEVELPKTAFITNFTMTINGVSYTGEVKEKEIAQKQYRAAVSRGQTAGLLKASGRKTENFKVSISIAPAKKIVFELTYEELLQRKLGKYEMVIKIKPMQLVNHFQIDAHIFEPRGIAFLNTHATFLTEQLENALIKNMTETKAHVSFKPTLEQQRKCPNCGETLLDGDFVLQYDVNRDLSSGDIQIVNGYFVHHFAPTNLPRVPKNVVFVIDRSFSMRGLKFKQTKIAFFRILGDMDVKDHFTLIVFDSTIETWRDSFVQATPENVLQAKKFILYLQLGAETNINDSLLLAVTLLDTAHNKKQLPEKSVSMIILLTDGDPNVGETDPAKIQINVKNAIRDRYSLYCLGFGFDVDYSFLEKIALDNDGVARVIYADSDAALQLQGFYDEVANPLLLDVELLYLENAISELTEVNFRQYFAGSEIVVAGKISDNSLDEFVVQISAQTVNSNLSLEGRVNISEAETILEHLRYVFGDFTERLWAYLTIQQLLIQRVSAESREKKILTDRALELSLKYNFVTPLTSMVVTKPEENKLDRILMANKASGNANLQSEQSGGLSPGWHDHHEPHRYVPRSNIGSTANLQSEQSGGHSPGSHDHHEPHSYVPRSTIGSTAKLQSEQSGGLSPGWHDHHEPHRYVPRSIIGSTANLQSEQSGGLSPGWHDHHEPHRYVPRSNIGSTANLQSEQSGGLSPGWHDHHEPHRYVPRSNIGSTAILQTEQSGGLSPGSHDHHEPHRYVPRSNIGSTANLQTEQSGGLSPRLHDHHEPHRYVPRSTIGSTANLQSEQSGGLSPGSHDHHEPHRYVPRSNIGSTDTFQTGDSNNFYSPAYLPVSSVDGDPHFIIPMQKQHDAACFNIAGKPGLIMNLVKDPFTGLKINGELIGDKRENGQKVTTYFGTFGLENRKINLRISVTTEVITIFYKEDRTIIPWSATVTLTFESFSISIIKEKNLIITMGDDATFVIVLHRVWKKHPLHRDFLGFYTLDSLRLSNMTHGLLGQFYHDIEAKIYNIHSGSDPQKPSATMLVKGRKLTVTRGWQKDYRLDSSRGANVPCWFVHNNGEGFIDGIHSDYIVSSLFDSTTP